MITCTKLFTDIPFAHRQPNHSSHCALWHGHNFSFQITFTASECDKCGFILDFGGEEMKEIKKMFSDLDHALVLNDSDPLLQNEHFMELREFYKLRVVKDCSAEGLAHFVAENADMIVYVKTNSRVRVEKVICFEDSKNSATWTRENCE